MAREPSTSTIEVPVELHRDRRGRTYRRIFVCAIAVVVVAGASGWLGVRSQWARARGADGLELAVRYPRVTRAGLPASVRIDVSQAGGLDESVLIGIDADYLERFDQQGVRPDPESAFSRGDLLVMEFAPPDRGDTISIRFDIIVETGAHFGRSNRVVILDDNGEELAGVSYKTTIVP